MSELVRPLVLEIINAFLGAETNTESQIDLFQFIQMRDYHERLQKSIQADGILSHLIHGMQLDAEQIYEFLFFGSYYQHVMVIFLGNLFHTLFQKPELHRQIRANAQLIPAFLAECERLYPPLIMLERFSVTDAVLNGKTISAGHFIFLALCAANRDPKVFSNPDEFRLDRDPTSPKRLTAYPDQAFPYGIWERIGQMITQVLVETLLLELPEIKPVSNSESAHFEIKTFGYEFRSTLQIPFVRFICEQNLFFQETLKHDPS